ncbi:MAG TPA: hypothetical protein VHK88_01075, partial [Aquihabitans sp.]|nr:hypothetical protein [Aquihabitans sp.]
VIGMLADLIGRATRATHEVQPAAGFTRDAPPTFPPAHGRTPLERPATPVEDAHVGATVAASVSEGLQA